jgi:hypothetical protein
VDAVFAPVFRYFDTIDEIGDFGILADKPKIARWRKSLRERPSVRCGECRISSIAHGIHEEAQVVSFPTGPACRCLRAQDQC